jgi:23S rRNA pseudouridine2605 synthase
MCDAIAHPVDRLRRTRLGPLALGRMKPGAIRDLTPAELRAFGDR